jgi:hypothetical protein
MGSVATCLPSRRVEGAYPGEGLGNVFDRQESHDDSVVLGLQFGG